MSAVPIIPSPVNDALQNLIVVIQESGEAGESVEELLRRAAHAWLDEGNTCYGEDGHYSTMANGFLQLAEAAVVRSEDRSPSDARWGGDDEALVELETVFETVAPSLARVWRMGDGDGGGIVEMLRSTIARRYPEALPRSPQASEARYQKRKLSAGTRTRIMERDEYRCRHCGTHRDLAVDHVVAEANGGSDDDENLQTLCRSCNSSKGTK